MEFLGLAEGGVFFPLLFNFILVINAQEQGLIIMCQHNPSQGCSQLFGGFWICCPRNEENRKKDGNVGDFVWVTLRAGSAAGLEWSSSSWWPSPGREKRKPLDRSEKSVGFWELQGRGVGRPGSVY